jgi:phosphate uptake regulator
VGVEPAAELDQIEELRPPTVVAAAVDDTLLGRFYERFADHAVEISRRVIFQVTGNLPAEEEIATY